MLEQLYDSPVAEAIRATWRVVRSFIGSPADVLAISACALVVVVESFRRARYASNIATWRSSIVPAGDVEERTVGEVRIIGPSVFCDRLELAINLLRTSATGTAISDRLPTIRYSLVPVQTTRFGRHRRPTELQLDFESTECPSLSLAALLVSECYYRKIIRTKGSRDWVSGYTVQDEGACIGTTIKVMREFDAPEHLIHHLSLIWYAIDYGAIPAEYRQWLKSLYD